MRGPRQPHVSAAIQVELQGSFAAEADRHMAASCPHTGHPASSGRNRSTTRPQERHGRNLAAWAGTVGGGGDGARRWPPASIVVPAVPAGPDGARHLVDGWYSPLGGRRLMAWPSGADSRENLVSRLAVLARMCERKKVGGGSPGLQRLGSETSGCHTPVTGSWRTGDGLDAAIWDRHGLAKELLFRNVGTVSAEYSVAAVRRSKWP
jgi:hypothetical protein